MVDESRRAIVTALAGISAMGMAGPALATAKKVARVKPADKFKYRGVVYDVGLKFTDAGYSVEPFSPALVEYDLRTIAKDLHCNTVRIEGEEILRLVAATRIAHKLGLTVFFNPWKMNANPDECRAYFSEAAVAAEQLRKEGVDIVFVAGCEFSIFNAGIADGKSVMERIPHLLPFFGKPVDAANPLSKLNPILASLAATVREKFQGRVTYSAGSWETVDWSVFDIVGVDYYRGAETDAAYVAGLDKYRVTGKPLVVMEVGCCAYTGAAPLGGGGFMAIEGINPDGTGKWKGGKVPERNEREQADYVTKQLELLSTSNVEGAFIYVFSFPSYPTGEGVRDLDMAAYGLVKTWPATDPRSKQLPPWAPKEAYFSVANFYKKYGK